LILFKNLIRGSNHPLSRRLYDYLPHVAKKSIEHFNETTGSGVEGIIEGHSIKIGSANFVGINDANNLKQTLVHVKIDDKYLGKFIFDNQYRDGLKNLFDKLQSTYKLIVLSGDNDGERESLQQLLPAKTEMIFNQKPEQKLDFIKKLQENGGNVMMVGDGLNDAGALAQSNVGISISENVNVFSPACDGILDASQFEKIAFFLRYSKNAMKTIYMSFGLSLLYNVIGLTYAVSGDLSPIFAAIIMPLSTITIVSFVTIMTNIFAKTK
jgi:Cu+-exporting ATPase